MMDKAGPTWWNAAIERVIKARKGLLKKPVDNKVRMALHPDTYRHLRRGSQRTLSDMKKRSRLSSTKPPPRHGSARADLERARAEVRRAFVQSEHWHSFSLVEGRWALTISGRWCAWGR
jgi:hypothetical protein